MNVGDKIYYCGRGPCVVGAIVRKNVCGTPAQFQSLSVLDGSGGEFLVPLGSVPSLPLRPLLHRQKMPELLSHLTECDPPKELANWKQRDLARSKLFSSGTVFDLADAVESLTHSSRIRNLAQDERQTLARAKRLLICEVAEVMNESENAAESRIDTVLKPGADVTDKLPRKFKVYRPRAKTL